MAILYENGFESGTYTDWYDDSTDFSGQTPVITSADKWVGTYSLEADISNGPIWVRHRITSGQPSAPVIRCYTNCVSCSETNEEGEIFYIRDSAQAKEMSIVWSIDGSGIITLKSKIDDGTNTYYGTATSAITKGTWYRIEAKLDLTTSSAKVTWGYASENNTLTTVETDFTGGNSWGTGTVGEWFLFGMNNWLTMKTRTDGISIANSGYPLGTLSDVTLDTALPDADVTTTGWTTTPLYSKINDASDATVIQATAS